LDFGPFLLLATLEGLVMAATLALTAVGLSLVFGVMRVVNVAHGEFFMVGAVVAWFVAQAVPGPPALGFVAALGVSPLVAAAIAVLLDRLVLRRLGYEPEAVIVATIGFGYVLQQGALSLYGPEARAVAAPFDLRIQLPWFGYAGYKLAVIAFAAVVIAAVWALLARTRIGLVMRATQWDRETATAFGIDVDRVYAIVFGLGAGLAALAAVLVVPIQQAHYLMGGDPLLLSFIVVIIGGLGSFRGTIVAALLVGLSDGIISVFFSPTLAKILATLLVALVLVFRPQGLFGRRTA
jgi:branched-chain amino acid transport system permease protein